MLESLSARLAEVLVQESARTEPLDTNMKLGDLFQGNKEGFTSAVLRGCIIKGIPVLNHDAAALGSMFREMSVGVFVDLLSRENSSMERATSQGQ